MHVAKGNKTLFLPLVLPGPPLPHCLRKLPHFVVLNSMLWGKTYSCDSWNPFPSRLVGKKITCTIKPSFFKHIIIIITELAVFLPSASLSPVLLGLQDTARTHRSAVSAVAFLLICPVWAEWSRFPQSTLKWERNNRVCQHCQWYNLMK